ncbi:MAG TPA: thioredoxin-like domain-containing protein, partial [Chitinophagaceae bacterium]|nr:thioredoxin-like domain-containing protein [Chitinophagaceae bacterium]
VKPFKNQYVYLGYYSGKQLPVVDSAKLNDKSEGVFKGTKKLGGGIYLIGYPDKNGFFELLIDKQQKFSVIADTSTLRTNGISFINSPDNVLFNAYQQAMSAKGKDIEAVKQQLAAAKTKSDSTRLNEELARLDKDMRQYRENLIKKNPDNILSTFLVAMREPVLPDSLKNPASKKDSVIAYNYFKDHFWDGVNFWDGRLARTPSSLFEAKLDKYFDELVVPHPDSVIKEIDWMLGYASPDEEMTKFLLLKFVNRYLNQKYMWEDAVFVHLFEKYFSNKNYSWLNDKGRKTISDRAYSLMANITGTAASDIELPDTAGKELTLFSQTAPYTIVCFWDPTCGHCKEIVPQLDSMYRNKWKAAGIKMFAVAKETDGTKKDWLSFIHEHSLQDWANVYYSKAEEKARTDAGVPGYSQLYDVQTFPTLYLLDKDKRIVAKKLTFQQIDEILQLKQKGSNN